MQVQTATSAGSSLRTGLRPARVALVASCAAVFLLGGGLPDTGSQGPGRAPAESGGAPATVTTVYIVRHAEKESEAQDTPLSKPGAARAEALAWVLGKTKPDVIFSTSYRRTKDTVAPLAQQNHLEVRTYRDSKSLLASIQQEYAGKTIVIAGHSNTIPELFREFGLPSEKAVLEGHDDLFVVTIVGLADGRVVYGLQHLRYAGAGPGVEMKK